MTMVKRTYSITETLDQYVKKRVSSGEFATDSEYLRALIRRDHDESKDIEFIRAALIEAEESGFSDTSSEQLLKTIKDRARVNGKL